MEKTRRLLIFLTLLAFSLAGCGETVPSGTGSKVPADLGTFKPGEQVAFRIDDTVHVCNDELPYAIVQVTDGRERRLMLRHSCIGIVGRGIDQYCENGQVRTVDVLTCSDAIFCEDQKVNEQVLWDQQEYVQISEECAGQTIHREVKQQVPAGNYRVVVQDWKEDHVESRIIAEFTIASE